MFKIFKHALPLLLSISPHAVAVNETPVEIIPLAAPLDHAQAELSGLTWCGSKLILLPQFPERFVDDGHSYFYYLEQQQITDYLDRVSTDPLKAKVIRVNEAGLRKSASIFDGFEAISCKDNKVWLSIEAKVVETEIGKDRVNETPAYHSFVVAGTIYFDADPRIELEPLSLTRLGSQSKLINKGDEAIIMFENDIIAIHEVNDKRIVEAPKATRVTTNPGASSEITFPHIAFRITDATELDQNNHFWVVNYKYSGDKFSRESRDLLTEKYGQGASHKEYYNLERLIEMKLVGDEIILIESPPISLEMNDVEGRNWEGLVRLNNRGFLLVTDMHPKTLFGFVPHALSQ